MLGAGERRREELPYWVSALGRMGTRCPADVRKWLDRAKTGGEPRSTENSLLLEELRDHLAATDTDPAWRGLAAHEVFGLRVYTYTGNMEIMTALAAVSGRQ